MRPSRLLLPCIASLWIACSGTGSSSDGGAPDNVLVSPDTPTTPMTTPDASEVFDATPSPDGTAPGDRTSPVDAPAIPDAAPSTTLGAVPTEAGVTFRVWAPAASAATVVGDFADTPMRAVGDGVWEASVAGARAGQRYRFVLTRGTQSLVRVDPRARELRDGWGVIAGPSTFAWRTANFRPPALRETVLYELHPGSFSVPGGAAHGTFASTIERLDSLADLGVNAIELMPVNDFASGTRWGYGPHHWHAVNAAYGSPDDLRRLVDEAHARGIAVLVDVVYNHYTGNTSAPLRCFDGDCSDGSGGNYFFRDARYRNTPWGPRPDFSNPFVARYLLDGVAMWLADYRVDGFRWDSVSNIRALDGMGTVPGGRELLVEANALTRRLRPGAIVTAEDLKGEAAITRASDHGGFGFDTQWDGFVYVMGEQLGPASDDGRDLNAVRAALLGRYNDDPFARITGSENHDTVGNGGARFPSRVDAANPTSVAGRKRSMLAAALAFTAPGVPMLFMGQELLAQGTFAPEPAALDWTQLSRWSSIRDYYRALVRMRRNLDGATAGLLGPNIAVTHQSDANKVLVFRRWDRGGDDVVVIANLRNRRYAEYNIGLPAGGTWRVRLDSDDPRWSADFTGPARASVDAVARPYDGQSFMGSIALGPWSVVVLSR